MVFKRKGKTRKTKTRKTKKPKKEKIWKEHRKLGGHNMRLVSTYNNKKRAKTASANIKKRYGNKTRVVHSVRARPRYAGHDKYHYGVYETPWK